MAVPATTCTNGLVDMSKLRTFTSKRSSPSVTMIQRNRMSTMELYISATTVLIRSILAQKSHCQIIDLILRLPKEVFTPSQPSTCILTTLVPSTIMECSQVWDLVKHLNTLPSANTTQDRLLWARKEGLYIHQNSLHSEDDKATATHR